MAHKGRFLVDSRNAHHALDPDATVALDSRVDPTFMVALPFPGTTSLALALAAALA